MPLHRIARAALVTTRYLHATRWRGKQRMRTLSLMKFVLLLVVLAFASGVLVGQRRMMRGHDEQVQALREELQSWKAHHQGDLPLASLLSTDPKR